MLGDYGPATYGDTYAEAYDEWYPAADAGDEAVARLTELAGERVLELGIGTGRVAVLLAERGLAVYGIDSSPKMLEVLRSKPAGAKIETSLGDFADVAIDGEFDLIYCVKNTFFMLTSQADQVRCFRSVGPHLQRGGIFLLETFAPVPSRFDNNQRVNVKQMRDAAVLLQASLHDPVTQTVTSHDIYLGPRGLELFPVITRYVWPSELDLMAELAGLRLTERWSDWSRRPFTADSKNLISLYTPA